MEGQLLSGQACGGQDVALLRGALHDGGDQLHLLSHAERSDRLKARNLALCVADSEKFSTPVELTADYGYFRLRDEGYTPEDLARWAHTIRTRAAGCSDVFVYFKHEEAGIGPQFARVLLDALARAPA